MTAALDLPVAERHALRMEIEDFLFNEAELLDERRFDEWLELLTEDVRYWMPMRRNVPFGETDRERTRERTEMSWFDEGKFTLTQRVKQLNTGVHWCEEPASRVTHMISNVQLLDVGPEEVHVKCR